MNIVIVGCGKVGSSLTRELSREGHDITVVDTKPQKVSQLVQENDVMGLVGNGIVPEIQLDAGIDQADVVIATTSNDELNLLCCLLARKLSGGCATIARVHNPEYSGAVEYLQNEMGISMIINPELEAARAIGRVLRLPSVISVDTFSKGLAEILRVKIQPDSGLANMPVKDIPARLKSDILVCVVERGGKAYIPDGDFILKAKDVISIAGQPANTSDFFRKIGIRKQPIHSIMIIGAGKLSFYLGKQLDRSRVDVTMIESKPETCDIMAQEFPEFTIVHGDGSDQNLLIEEGLDEMDAFISLTGIDEENIFLSLYARGRTGIKTITKINRIRFDEVINSLDLDTIINPKSIAAEMIIRYVRALANATGSNVETVNRLASDQVEAIEFNIRKDSRATGIPLQSLNLKPGVLVALIQRGGQVILPRGSDELLEDDTVIIVTSHTGFTDIDDILEKNGGGNRGDRLRLAELARERGA